MIKKREYPRVFFGWWTVIAGGVIDLWGAGFQVYGISALFKPIASELGFSRAQMTFPSSIGRLEGGLEGPLIGWISDKHGYKWLIMAGVFCMALALIMMNYVGSLWAYVLVWGVLLGTGHNMLASPIDKAITDWFVKKRGLALSIRWVLSGLSGVLVLPLIAWLITTQDWRMTCVIGGVVMVLIGFPLVLFGVKQKRPEYYGMLPDGARVETGLEADTDAMIDKGVEYASSLGEIEFTARQALRTPAYWMIVGVQTVYMLMGPVMSIHLIPFLTDRGIDLIKAAGMMALMIGASIPSRFIGGLLADRLNINHIRYLKGGAYLLQALGVTVFLLNPTIEMIFVWFILYGIGQGSGQTVNPLMMARYFGRKAYGSIRGTMTVVATPIGIVAPVYAGWIYDTTGSYMTAFVQLAVLIAVAGIVTFFIFPPKPPTQISDVRKIL
ncbi:MFS transporter [Chloroflexota bacterium]